MTKNSSILRFRGSVPPFACAIAASILSVGCIGTKGQKSASVEASTLGSPEEAGIVEANEETPVTGYVIGQNAVQHEIVSGDTLSGIGEKYGVTMASIKEANQLKSSRIIAGKSLIIPTAASATPIADSTTPVSPAPVLKTPEPEIKSEPVLTQTPPPSPDSSITGIKSVDDRANELRSAGASLGERMESTKTDSTPSLSPRVRASGTGYKPVSVPPIPGAEAEEEEDEFIPILP